MKGIKNQLLPGYGTGINRSDPSTWEIEMLESREEKFALYQKILSIINKRYINTKSKYRNQQLPEELGGKHILDAQTKSTINCKIEVRN